MTSMLQGSPWLLAHSSMLAINQPRKISLYGNDYVMWKDDNGNIHALSNACPHMGAMLSEGWCEVEGHGVDRNSTVVCPFHALRFDDSGCTVLPNSSKKTLPLLKPLELIVRDDFIWTYGGYEPKIEIPSVLNEVAKNYNFLGHTGDRSVETDLLTMLLNMHDYNHQNGTHRELFRITEVKFHKFVDEGHVSHAYYEMPTAPYSLLEKIKKPDLLLLPTKFDAIWRITFHRLLFFMGKLPWAEQLNVISLSPKLKIALAPMF